MTTIPLIYCANHMFVDLPEGRWLVDTGSPATFGTAGHVTWGGVRRSVPQQFGPVGIPEIQTHVDSPFVGMIGTDLLNAQDSCWDGPAGEFRIGDANVHPEATPIEFERLMGVPTLQARIGAHSARCLFDTGAQFGYVLNEQLVEGGIPDGRITDFNPIIGAIDSAAWRAEVGLGATRSRMKAEERLYAYHRQICKRCGSGIEVPKIGGRPIWYCPCCQPARAALQRFDDPGALRVTGRAG